MDRSKIKDFSSIVDSGKKDVPVSDDRPYFSVIVACYNTKLEWMKALLSSILAQGMKKEEIEIILVDDGSNDKSYLDAATMFNDCLDIRFVMRERGEGTWNGHGAARQAGLDAATGRWIVFADHDDEFISGTFPKIREMIKENEEPFFVQAQFLYMLEDGTLIRLIEAENAWNHGKFMNKDNLLRSFGIHFKRELETHEDICFQSQICAALAFMQRKPLSTQFPIYKWYARIESASNEYKEVEVNGAVYQVTYLFEHFDDYLESTYGTYKGFYLQGMLSKENMRSVAMTTALYCYHYSESSRFYLPPELTDGMMESIKGMMKDMYELLDITRDEILLFAAANDAAAYQSTMRSCEVGARPCFPLHTLPDYLEEVCPVPYKVVNENDWEEMPSMIEDVTDMFVNGNENNGIDIEETGENMGMDEIEITENNIVADMMEEMG